MPAPLVERFLALANESADPLVRAECAAHIACYEARIGEFASAEAKRIELRTQFGSGHFPRISILIMCLEALQLYFRELSPMARDRMLRANLISASLREQSLHALTSAWLAHIEFNLGDYGSMARNLRACAENLESDDGSAECRMALVIGDALLHCDLQSDARRWHEKARVLASRLGDQASFGAITYNRAAMRVSCARLRALIEKAEASDISLVDAEVRSAVNYQATARLKSLEHLLGSARVGVLMLREQFALAESEISELLVRGDVPTGTGEEFLLHADRLRCSGATGNTKSADVDLAFLTSASLAHVSADDQALIYQALGKFFDSVGAPEQAAQYQGQCQQAANAHAATIRDLRQQLSPYMAVQA